MKEYLLKCGASIPQNNKHAVSVSLPTVDDVIGYEEKRPFTIARILSGYPRFVRHPFVKETIHYLQKKYSQKGNHAILPGINTFKEIINKFSLRPKFTAVEDDIYLLELPKNRAKSAEILSFIQHTGCIVSSRRAEDFLLKNGLVSGIQSENSEKNQPEEKIKKVFSSIYKIDSKDIFISASGMNAVYSAFSAINKTSIKKNTWIQLGWLYVDNIELLKKYSGNAINIPDVNDFDSLERAIKANKNKIAGIITEIPTNPLLKFSNLQKLASIKNKYNIPLILDISLASSYSVDVLEYSDVTIESLTKFACGKADVMLGAIIMNPKSRYNELIKNNLPDFIVKPYIRDMERLAHEIKNYSGRMKKISSNSEILADFFSKNKNIQKLHYSNSESTSDNFKLIRRNKNYNLGIITIETKKPINKFYDNLELLKGPSFGTEFTLNMLYMYLAHYDMVSSLKGKKLLKSAGINPELVRISVGTENPDDLIKEYEKALK